MYFKEPINSGIAGLDRILDHIRLGDNVVWEITNIKDYKSFVKPFVDTALINERKVVYMRFANHEPILEDISKVDIFHPDITSFEKFASSIYNLIDKNGKKFSMYLTAFPNLLISGQQTGWWRTFSGLPAPISIPS